MKIRLSHYIEKIEKEYIKSRAEWEKVQKKLEEEQKRFDNIEWLYLTPEGKTAENIKHNEKKEALFKEVAEIRKSFIESVDNIKADSDKLFDRAYKHTPELIDNNGLAIINNSNLEIDELIDLAENYREKGNMTMYFLIAEKLREVGKDKDYRMLSDSERRGKAYYEKAHEIRTTRPDHDLIEGFKEICLGALREEAYLSNGIHNIHEEEYQRHLKGAEEIITESASPFD